LAEPTAWLPVRVDRHWFGVEVARVQEVLASRPVTRVPMAPPGLAGLVQVRGEILVAVDLRQRLGLPTDAAAGRQVVVRSTVGPVSLLVDEVGEVCEGAVVSPPEALSVAIRDVAAGALPGTEGPMLVLDVDRATQVSAFGPTGPAGFGR